MKDILSEIIANKRIEIDLQKKDDLTGTTSGETF